MGKGVRRGITVTRRILGRSDAEAVDDKQDHALDHGRTITDGNGAANLVIIRNAMFWESITQVRRGRLAGHDVNLSFATTKRKSSSRRFEGPSTTMNSTPSSLRVDQRTLPSSIRIGEG